VPDVISGDIELLSPASCILAINGLSMKDPWIDKWNDRYSKEEFAYGEQPNNYLKELLGKLPPAKILFPAEGEGRNAVFAARNGWTVAAFDISIAGRNKALKLAQKNKVSLDYKVGELENLVYEKEWFDVIALIYAHFPAEKKSLYHKILDQYLRRGGSIIFEAFSKKHIAYNSINQKVGGPKDSGVLFSLDEIRADFKNYEVEELTEKEIELNEGLYHIGRGSVIRFVGRKK
jgi:hypothetical protein